MPQVVQSQGKRVSVAGYAVLVIAVFLGLLGVRLTYDYLLFHSLVELFAIAVAAGTFMVAWNLRRYFDTGYLVVLAVAFFFAACVDTLHLLAYRGMGVFPDADADLPTQLWLIARYLQTAGLLIAPAFARRKISAVAAFWLFAAATGVLLASVFVFDVFPVAFVEGAGLTPFKIWSEYLISAAMLLSLAAVWRYRDTFTREVVWLLSGVILTAVAAEIAFTLYTDPFGAWNFIGHMLKVLTFFLLYRAIVETALTRPLDVLFGDLQQASEELRESEVRFRSTFEQATIGIAHVSLDGRWLRFNRRLAEIAGHSPEALRQIRPEDITHAEDRPAEIALIRRLLEGDISEYRLEKRYIRGDGTVAWVEVSRTLMRGPDGAPKYFIATIEDISERKEREGNLRRSRDLTAALSALDLAINAMTDVAEITRAAAEAGCDALGAESAAVLMRDGKRWRPGHLYRFPHEKIPLHAPGDRPVPVADDDGGPLIVDDAFTHKRMSPETMRILGIRSLATIPLRFRGQDLGVIYMNYHSAPHRFTDLEVDFARRLSSSVTLAIENARLYASQRMISDTLQSALLAMPSSLPGLELAHVYRSATELARIGGDFYDVFEVSDDRVALVLGDVSGKGIEAATLTAMAKSTIRAYAYQDPRPDAVLGAANDAIASQIGDSRFITALYGTIHVPTGRLELACAGHPQPVLCMSGRCTDDAITSSPPLGVVPGGTFECFSMPLDPGSLLVAFSDGLIEARSSSGFLGEERVKEAVARSAGGGPAAVIDALVESVEAHCGGTLGDDVAVIALRYTGPATGVERSTSRES
ncbi:MAG: SpoIIE family protein phosphatase [Coriobacteriia bacterium]|nr:SpoIIE family protein phosphatase [Coriobacteriia bacterium]